MIKHLLMHVWPKADKAWRLTVAEVAARMPLFDGLKLVAVATSHDAEPSSAVRAMLPSDVEVFEVPNDPSLREVVSFTQLLERASQLPGHTFYCHGKGSTHDAGSLCQEWGRVMCEVLLDNYDLVSQVLLARPMAGCFTRNMRFGLNPNNWHYSGSFYWMRNETVFADGRDWRGVDRYWFGVEAWPGRLYERHQVGTVFLDGAGDLYNGEYWDSVVRPALKSWRRHPCANVETVDSTLCDFARLRAGYSKCIKCGRVVHDVKLLQRYTCGKRQRPSPMTCPHVEEFMTSVNGVPVHACSAQGACAHQPVGSGVHVCEALQSTPRVLRCHRLGNVVDHEPCASCGDGKTSPVYVCALYQKCLIKYVRGSSLRSCDLCQDYSVLPAAS